MRSHLLACTVSLACLFSALAGPPLVMAAASDQTPAARHGKLMPWDDTLLAAHIYLGRLPAAMSGNEADTPERISLGKKLYFERGISLNKTKSCHDCHFLTNGQAGADYTPTSKGASGTFGKRNTPTVINAGFQLSQFWDGRAHDLKEQAKGPILNPVEMELRTPEEVLARLRNIGGYPEAFRRAFPGEPEPMTYDNLAEAIASFERTLVAPGRFDRLLDGDLTALTPQEKRGLAKFLQYNCVECHTSVTAGGRLYRKSGMRHPFEGEGDLGRYEVTKQEEDRFFFKVPMLRNVTRTAPYFHDGRVADLKEAVRLMGWHQLDLRLGKNDIADLIAFLGTLEGNPPPVEAPR